MLSADGGIKGKLKRILRRGGKVPCALRKIWRKKAISVKMKKMYKGVVF